MNEEITKEQYDTLLKILINLGKSSNYRSITGIWGELVTHSRENTALVKHFMPKLDDLFVSLLGAKASFAKRIGVEEPHIRREVIQAISTGDYSHAVTPLEKISIINTSLDQKKIPFQLPPSFADSIDTIIQDTIMLENGIYNAYLLRVKNAVDDLIVYCKKYQADTLPQIEDKLKKMEAEYDAILKLEIDKDYITASKKAKSLLAEFGHIPISLQDKDLETLGVFINFESDSLKCMRDIRLAKPTGEITINDIRDSIAKIYVEENILANQKSSTT